MKLRLLSVEMDLGAGRRGVDMGPSALRIAGIRERLEQLGHDVEDDRESIFVPTRERAEEFDPRLKFLPEVHEGCVRLSERVYRSKRDGAIPIVMGGDHSIAIGTVAGVSTWCREAGVRLGVVWIDAHADFNTAVTTPSGNIHGMPLAVITGRGVEELTSIMAAGPIDDDRVALIGVRDLDQMEKTAVKESGIRVFTMADIDRSGMAAVAEQAIAEVAAVVDVLHISFDVDSLDPDIAPGVGTPVAGGLSFRELHLLMETVASAGIIGSFEVVEVNPVLDVRNKTAETAVEMVSSALGETIL